MFDLPIHMFDVPVRMGIVLAGVLLCVSVRSFCRVMMAICLGDRLGVVLNRYTLNPLSHIHFISTLALPAALVLLAMITGSLNVPFVALELQVVHNPFNFRYMLWGKGLSANKAQFMITLAGLMGNVLFALLCWAVAGLLVAMQWFRFYTYSPADALMHLAYLNVTLVIFHMLPIFPLDGAFIWPRFFSDRMFTRFFIIRPWISVTLTAVLILGGGSWVALLARRITHQMLSVFI